MAMARAARPACMSRVFIGILLWIDWDDEQRATGLSPRDPVRLGGAMGRGQSLVGIGSMHAADRGAQACAAVIDPKARGHFRHAARLAILGASQFGAPP